MWVKQKFCVKRFRVIKILGQKIFWVKNFWDEKNFGQKDLDPKFFCLKKQVGLTQGGGYMTAPPPENNRVKIVLGCCLFCLLTLPTKF